MNNMNEKLSENISPPLSIAPPLSESPSESIDIINNQQFLLNNSNILNQLPIDQYRMQLYNYALQAERLRLSQQYTNGNININPYGNNNGNTNNNYQTNRVFNYFHPRFQINNEEPKPQHSYIGLIAMAILSNPDMKLVLSDIYQYILDNYSYFRSRGPGWRNSIRHNLSLNDCFIKSGRSANGKGHYWSIHPANIDDFKKGDFRRRKAQRKVRKHMGLSVDDDNDSNSPPPLSPPINFNNLLFQNSFHYFPHILQQQQQQQHHHQQLQERFQQQHRIQLPISYGISRKRQFDVDSLLAPEPSNHINNNDNNNIDENNKRHKYNNINSNNTYKEHNKYEEHNNDKTIIINQSNINYNIKNQIIIKEQKQEEEENENNTKLINKYKKQKNKQLNEDQEKEEEQSKNYNNEYCSSDISSDNNNNNDNDIDVVNNNNDNCDNDNKLHENLILQTYYQTIALRTFQMYKQQIQYGNSTEN